MRGATSKEELDTPALCLDLDAFERNLRRMREAAERGGFAVRPHAKAHKCPEIAARQMAAGAIGICVAKVSEAEVMRAHGIGRILIATPNVTPSKIRRAMRLAAEGEEVIQVVDHPDNARDLSAAAEAAGIVAAVLVDVDPGRHRTGAVPGAPALELARLVERLPGLRLRGVQYYDGPAQHHPGWAERRERARRGGEGLAETLHLMRADGLSDEIVSGGGTGTYDFHRECGEYTEIQAGSYVLMDAQYRAIGGAGGGEFDDFEPALTALATVISANHAGFATGDAGVKALTEIPPGPVVLGDAGASYHPFSDEFGFLRFAEASRTARLGERIELIVPHCDPVINLHDRIHATRGGVVEAAWPIAARGMSQ